MPDPKLLAEIKEKARQYVDEMAHDWVEIPGAIAEATLVEMVLAVTRQYGEDTTIADVAALLGMDDVIEDFVKESA